MFALLELVSHAYSDITMHLAVQLAIPLAILSTIVLA